MTSYPEPYMTIEQAEATTGPWHGVEPCEGCGSTHIPIWAHVDYEEDTRRGAELRELAYRITEARPPMAMF